MKIRSLCPHCNYQLPRVFALKVVPHIEFSCPKCDQKMKTEPISEWLGGALFGIPIGILLAGGIYEKISWAIAGIGILAIAAAIIYLFPYTTKFVRSTKSV